MKQLLSVAVRVGGVGAAVLALAASSTDGERARGDCPSGERCAEETPEGLSFEGAQVSWFIGNGVANTAVGGGQTILITDKATDAPLAFAFAAKVTSDVFEAGVAGAASATLSASAAGRGHLRITRAGSDDLFDRIAIESRVIDRMQARPTMNETWPGFSSDSWAAFAGGSVEVAVALYDSGGGWLVDDTMQLTSNALVRRTAWDALELRPTAAGTVTLQVGAGDRNDSVPVTVVDTLTEVSGPGPQDRAVGMTAEVCFQALAGSVRVFGVPWEFVVSGPGEALAAAEQLHHNCLSVRTTGLGTITVTAHHGQLSASGEINVVSGATRRAAPAAGWVTRTDLGERAASIDD